MLQSINKSKIYFYIISFVFLSTIANNNALKILKSNFLISNIEIKTNYSEVEKKILNKTNYLLNKNILLINKTIISNNLSDLNFLEKVEIKKKFPSTITIKASRTDIIGITYKNQKKYYVGLNGKFILPENLTSNEKLPLIFGNFKIQKLIKLLNILKNKNIDSNLISKYYFHKNKRWDLYLKDNIIIKLPSKNIENALDKYKNFKKLDKVKPNIILDLRISNRIVIKNV